MSDWRKRYARKLRTSEEAVADVRSAQSITARPSLSHPALCHLPLRALAPPAYAGRIALQGGQNVRLRRTSTLSAADRTAHRGTK